MLCLSDINGSDKNGEEWINAINHGCLWQVNEVFQTFLTIEELIWEELCLEKCTCGYSYSS